MISLKASYINKNKFLIGFILLLILISNFWLLYQDTYYLLPDIEFNYVRSYEIYSLIKENEFQEISDMFKIHDQTLGYPLYLSIYHFIFPDFSFDAMRKVLSLQNIFFYMLLAWSSFQILKRYTSESYASYATSLILLFPLFLGFSRTLFTAVPLLGIFSLFFYSQLVDFEKNRISIYTIVLFVIGAFMKQLFLVYALIPLIYQIIKARKQIHTIHVTLLFLLTTIYTFLMDPSFLYYIQLGILNITSIISSLQNNILHFVLLFLLSAGTVALPWFFIKEQHTRYKLFYIYIFIATLFLFVYRIMHIRYYFILCFLSLLLSFILIANTKKKLRSIILFYTISLIISFIVLYIYKPILVFDKIVYLIGFSILLIWSLWFVFKQFIKNIKMQHIIVFFFVFILLEFIAIYSYLYVSVEPPGYNELTGNSLGLYRPRFTNMDLGFLKDRPITKNTTTSVLPYNIRNHHVLFELHGSNISKYSSLTITGMYIHLEKDKYNKTVANKHINASNHILTILSNKSPLYWGPEDKKLYSHLTSSLKQNFRIIYDKTFYESYVDNSSYRTFNITLYKKIRNISYE